MQEEHQQLQRIVVISAAPPVIMHRVQPSEQRLALHIPIFKTRHFVKMQVTKALCKGTTNILTTRHEFFSQCMVFGAGRHGKEATAAIVRTVLSGVSMVYFVAQL